MIIKPEIIERINGTKTALKKEMAEEMGGITMQAVNHALGKNRNNGWLTSKPILELIALRLNTSIDDILIEKQETVSA